MKFSLFNRKEKYLGNVQNITVASHTMELNARDTLDIETFSRLEMGYRVLTHSKKTDTMHEFIAVDVEEFYEHGQILYKAYCESSFYEIMFDFINDIRAINTTALEALKKVLTNTRWTVGHVDDLGLGTAIFYRTNAKSAVEKILETWKCELHTRVYRNNVTGELVREVNLYKNRGEDSGKRLTYKSGMLSISRKTLREDVITALYGFGKGEDIEESSGYGRRIDFSTINNGKAYLENSEALLEWGRRNSDGTISHKFGTIIYDDIEDVEKLKAWTAYDLEIMSKPRISYEIKAVDLSEVTGERYHKLNLGDFVKVIDHTFTPPINHSPRVVRIVRDLLHEENTEITLGEKEIQESERQVKRGEILERIVSKEKIYDTPREGNTGGGTVDEGAGIQNYGYFTVDESGTLTAFHQNGKDPSKPLEPMYNVVIPEIYKTELGTIVTVKRIDSEVFSKFSVGYGITGLTLPETLKSIGAKAFLGNSITGYLTIPDSVTSIEPEAFSMNDIEQLHIGTGLRKIESNVFAQNKLSKITIPGTIEAIEFSAFSSQKVNVSITIRDGVKSVGHSAFSGNSISELSIGGTVEEIGNYAFAGTLEKHGTLTAVILPSSLLNLGTGAFQYNLLTTIILPDNLSMVEGLAFRGNNLTSVNLGNGVHTIKSGAFMENKLDTISFPSNIKQIDGGAFRYNNFASFVIPETVDVFVSNSFSDNPLSSFTIYQGFIYDGTINGYPLIQESPDSFTYIFSDGAWRAM